MGLRRRRFATGDGYLFGGRRKGGVGKVRKKAKLGIHICRCKCYAAVMSIAWE